MVTKMAEDGEEPISDQEKVRIISDFILHSPPGEFNEVFNDVRGLINNDLLLKEGAYGACVIYNKDQLTPVKLNDHKVLITEYNDLGMGRFFDPRTKQSFKFEHLRKETSDYESWEPDPSLETWRTALELEFDAYTLTHFKQGSTNVFAKKQDSTIILIGCIEDHQFQPQNYWNGRWRSQWVFSIDGNNVDVKGILKVQVHYYEDGNVQLVTSKEIKETFEILNEEQAVKEMIKIVEDSENEYQAAISDNYQTMSETTFKALRRQLPVTRTKIDWNKIATYNIVKELKQSS